MSGNLAHTEGESVVENRVEPDCENAGSYDNVVYCTVCSKELSRVKTKVDALGHKESEIAVENRVEPDCENVGSYDNVVYCTVCSKEISRETVTLDAKGHSYCEYISIDKKEHELCCECGDSIVSAHRWNKGEIITEPTYESAGKIKYVCEDCAEETVEDIEALTRPGAPDEAKKEIPNVVWIVVIASAVILVAGVGFIIIKKRF